MNTKFSIITPVYNGEKYIENCIKAIVNSKYDLNHIEHIIIDDGSMDRTKLICETWAKKYKHIKFYSKENGNWGSVINYVKNNKLATGDYIIVCDSDDIILPKAFKLIDQKNNNADFVIGDFYWFNGKRKTFRVPSYVYLFKTFFNKRKDDDYFNVAFYPHCSYISKRIFYALPDLKNRLFYQDSIMYTNALLMSNTIKHIQKAVSLYWKGRPGNSCTRVDDLTIESILTQLHYYEEHNMFTPFFYFMMNQPKYIKKHFKNNAIKFKFSKQKLNLSGYPFYIRPILKLIYLFGVRKYINKNDV